MSLEEPQSHTMPQKEREEKQEEKKKKNCDVKLAYPEINSGKTRQMELCLPLPLISSQEGRKEWVKSSNLCWLRQKSESLDLNSSPFAINSTQPISSEWLL